MVWSQMNYINLFSRIREIVLGQGLGQLFVTSNCFHFSIQLILSNISLKSEIGLLVVDNIFAIVMCMALGG